MLQNITQDIIVGVITLAAIVGIITISMFSAVPVPEVLALTASAGVGWLLKQGVANTPKS